MSPQKNANTLPLAARAKRVARILRTLAREFEAIRDSPVAPPVAPPLDVDSLISDAQETDHEYHKQKAIYIPPALYKQAQDAASRLQISLKSMVREILKRELPKCRKGE